MNLMLCAMLLNKRSSRGASSSRCMCTTSARSSGRSCACGGATRASFTLLFPTAYEIFSRDTSSPAHRPLRQGIRRGSLRMLGSRIKRLKSRFQKHSVDLIDESAIEAEAVRRSSSDLELLDRMLTSLESRRDKALGCVAEYRVSL